MKKAFGIRRLNDISSGRVSLLFRLVRFLELGVLVLELVNTTCRIDQFVLPGIIRVRGTRDLELNQWVSLPIDLNGLFGVGSRLGQKHIVIGHVFEGYQSIIFRMDPFLHRIQFYTSAQFLSVQI